MTRTIIVQICEKWEDPLMKLIPLSWTPKMRQWAKVEPCP